MYRNILVPLDGSELAERSLKHALEIASAGKGRLILLTVVEPVNPGLIFSTGGFGKGAEDLLDGLIEQKETEAKEYIVGLVARFKNIEVELQTVLKTGKAAEEIIKFADSNNVDLIIMSTHGPSGINRLVMGSVTDEVIRSSRVPILVIPPELSS